ncbi:MAG: calcium/sodium antiporter [Deltaproteobacteria bacterium]|nr:calcium/sodium antiporter [Deltaproteobacteria bacterium]
MTINILLFTAGLLMLYYGAEWLVRGSSSLAGSLGMQPIVIGLTVVAFGTSAPELVVSLVSSIKGKSMIAVGNIIGSNICNIALVLGMTALFQPIKCHPSVVKRDIPIMLGITLYFLVVSGNSTISRIEGASLVGAIVLYIYYNYRVASRRTSDETVAVQRDGSEILPVKHRSRQIALIAAGIAGVVIGAEILINSAVKIMVVFGVSEKFIGLTIVAFGTSLPELATSVIAAMKKEMDISLGNLVGSNVFNILAVLGAAALANPIVIPGGFMGSGLFIDYMVMMTVSAMPFFMIRKSFTLSRMDGAILLTTYGGYIAYLVLKG